MKKKLLYLVYSLLFFLPARLLAQHVVISQVYGGGGNGGSTYKNDFIELYNPTNANVDISTWSVQYMSTSGTGVTQASNVTNFTAGTIIKAHSYFLIQELAGAGGTTDLPTPDVNNGVIAMGSSGGKVALVSNQTMLGSGAATGSGIIDFVGWGTATTFEGTGPAPATTNPTSVARKLDTQGGSGYDTDDNANDFTLQTTITPHNSSVTITAATPTLTSSPTSLDFGTTQTVGSTSSSQSFTIGSSNLTAGATVTLTGSYLISKDNVTFASTPLTYSTTELATPATSKVYVQFKPTGTGATTGSVKVSSTGATDATVNLTGTAVAAANPATLAVNPATLTFPGQTVGQTSTSQFFNFTATNLSDVVTATASGPYLVSKDGIGFSNVVTYTTAEAALSPKVYVQFTPTALGAATASTITISTATATSKTVTLSGTGVAATPPAGIANHIVMSEVYGGGGNTNAVYTNDFVELYNPTSADVVMTNWSLQYTSAAGTAWGAGGTNPTIASFSGTIRSHGFFLIQLAAGTVVTNKPLPTPDATGTINMSASSGKIALVNNSTQISQVANPTDASIVDLVGFFYSGTAPTGYENTAVTVPSTLASNTWSIERKANANSTQATLASGGADELLGNGYDTDNNSTDFVGQSVPNPQNSSSPLESIPVPTYTATPATLTFNQNVNTTSAGVAVTLSGLGTLPATSVGTSGPYLISKTATGGYTSTLSFTDAEMAATPKPVVYVQFTPTALGAANSNLYITGVGAVQQIIPLNGTGTAQPVPTLTANPTTLTFSSTVGVAAAVQNYTLSGTNITQPTTVTTTGPYLVSKDGATFTSSVTFATNELNAAQTPKVYVRYIPTVVGANNGTAVQTTTGGGTVSTTVTLTGTGIAPPNAAPTMTAITDQSVCFTTTPQVIAINAISPVEAGQTVIVSATNDNPGLFSQFGVLPLTATTAQINYTLAPGASGTANVVLKLKDNGGTANSGVDTLLTKFKITVNALAVVNITSDVAGNLVEKGSTATLTASGGVSYIWTANATIISSLTDASVQVRPSVATTYTVTATNASGCTTTKSIAIGVRAAEKLETSNVLTPNGDGINDVWVIRNIDLYPTNNVKIFDKAGKMVYSKTGYNNDWNGYYNGSPLIQGTYYYVVDLGSGQTYRGYISIVRD